MNTILNVTRSSMPGFDEYCDEIRELWDTRWLTNMGTKHQQLQDALEQRLACGHVTLFVNGHSALEAMLSAFQFPRGSEVITTPYTFASTTHAIVRCGLVPVFCDIDPVTCCMDPAKIEPLITDKTVAILPVHVYGIFCDTDAIQSVADRHGLKVLYDAAHAFGVTRQGRSAACFGDVTMFSFHATKVFHSVEGGALCYRDDSLTTRFNDWKNFGIRGPESVACTGGNAKMNELQAAMGICNLRHLDEEIAKRRQAFDRYYARLCGVPGLRLKQPQEGVESNYAYFPVFFEDARVSRDRIAERLLENGIYARKYFYPLTNSYPCYRDLPTARPELTPVAKRISESVLTLPLFADLLPEEVDLVCTAVLKSLAE